MQRKNILRHSRAWKPSYTSIIILVSEGTGWAQKQQEVLACSWKHRPMVRQDVPAGATFRAHTQALTISPTSAQIRRRLPDAPNLEGISLLRHRRQWSMPGMAMNGKLISNGVARSAYRWNTWKGRRRFRYLFRPDPRGPRPRFVIVAHYYSDPDSSNDSVYKSLVETE